MTPGGAVVDGELLFEVLGGGAKIDQKIKQDMGKYKHTVPCGQTRALKRAAIQVYGCCRCREIIDLLMDPNRDAINHVSANKCNQL
jgi:hypothetical protein